MSRTLASIEALLLITTLAACGPATTAAPVSGGGGGGTSGASLAVTLAESGEEGSDEGSPWTRTLAPADGSRFPAVVCLRLYL